MAYQVEKETGKNITADLRCTDHGDALPALTIDYLKFAHLLDDPEITEDQKREYIETCWNIVMMFVDMGFGIHPVQQAQNACEHLDKKPSKLAMAAPDALPSSDKTRIGKFTGAASREYEPAAGRSNS